MKVHDLFNKPDQSAAPFITDNELAAAQEELDEEKVERAMAWDRLRERVLDAKVQLAHTLQWRMKRFSESGFQKEWGEHCLHEDAAKLIEAIEKLERLEKGL